MLRGALSSTSVMCTRESDACRAAITAIREELSSQDQTQNCAQADKAEKKRSRFVEKALRQKAETAFLAALGTRGDFARLWPSVFVEEIRSRQVSVDNLTS